jgi:two-component system, cell cycle response regulator DivK
MMCPQTLIAEDDAALQSLFAKVFSFAGFEVQCVDDGDLALEHLNATLPDVMVLDIQLPGASGLQIMDYLHTSRFIEQVHVIVVTANSHLAESSVMGYADLVLIKPVDVGDLVTLAKRLVSVPAA